MMRRIRSIWVLALMLIMLGSLANVAFAAPLPQGTGQICVQAYDDVNGNGVRDADEKLLAGVGFTLSDDNGVKSSDTTDGLSEPYCFGKLAGGSYTVRAKAPAGYESTTEGQWAISLASGAQFDAKYGANKPGGAPTNPANPSNNGGPVSTATTGSGTSTFGRILLGGLGVIILLVAGFMAGMFVQRSRAK
jgi:hypothetical protein